MALFVKGATFYLFSCLLMLVSIIVSKEPKAHVPLTEDAGDEVIRGKTIRPVIGILSLDSTGVIKNNYKWSNSYIDAAYVKFVEMAGARVLPILIEHPDDYYAKSFQSINGLILPGEGVSLLSSSYLSAAQKLYHLAVQANINNDYFPVWGNGMGFEALLTLQTTNDKWATPCSLDDMPSPLVMTKDFGRSRLFGPIDDYNLYAYLTTLPVASNFHPVCLTLKKFNDLGLNKHFHALSVQKNNDSTYVTSFEAFAYPFYGLSWHPEKNPFEWRKTSKSPHSLEAVKIAQYFANIFVDEARRNSHKFSDDSRASQGLIYNYKTYQLQNIQIPFTELYLFKNTTTGK